MKPVALFVTAPAKSSVPPWRFSSPAFAANAPVKKSVLPTSTRIEPPAALVSGVGDAPVALDAARVRDRAAREPRGVIEPDHAAVGEGVGHVHRPADRAQRAAGIGQRRGDRPAPAHGAAGVVAERGGARDDAAGEIDRARIRQRAAGEPQLQSGRHVETLPAFAFAPGVGEGEIAAAHGELRVVREAARAADGAVARDEAVIHDRPAAGQRAARERQRTLIVEPGAVDRERLRPEEHRGRVGQPTPEGDGGIETHGAGIDRQRIGDGAGLREDERAGAVLGDVAVRFTGEFSVRSNAPSTAKRAAEPRSRSSAPRRRPGACRHCRSMARSPARSRCRSKSSRR